MLCHTNEGEKNAGCVLARKGFDIVGPIQSCDSETNEVGHAKVGRSAAIKLL